MEVTNNISTVSFNNVSEPVQPQVQAVQPQVQVNTAIDSAGVKYEASSEDSGITLNDMRDIGKVLNNNTVAEFGVYEPMNRITIKIKDKDSGELLKEIPSEKMLKVFAKACEIAGILVDEKM